MEWAVFFAAGFGEGFEFGTLIAVKFRGHFDKHLNDEIATGAGVEALDAFFAESKTGAVLRSSGDFEVGFALEGGRLKFAPKRSSGEGNGQFTIKIVFVALENRVFLDVDDHVKIAWIAPAQASFAVAGAAETRAVVDPTGDFEFDAAGFVDAAIAPAAFARAVDGASGAGTFRAGLRDLEETATADDLTAALAHGAGGDFGTGLRASAIAGVAGVGLGDFDFFFDTESGFFEGDLQVVTQIAAALTSVAVGASASVGLTKDLLKNAAPAPTSAALLAEDFAEDVEGIVETAATTGWTGSAAGEGLMPVAIVGSTFIFIHEDIVSFADLFKFILGSMVAGIFIGVKLNGELAVAAFDFFAGGAAGDAEHFVIVAFDGRHGKKSGLSGGFVWGVGGSFGGWETGGDDDIGGAEKPVAEFVAFANLANDDAFSDVGGSFLCEGFVEIGVEFFADGVDGGNAEIDEKILGLLKDHIEAEENTGALGVAPGGGEAEFEIIENGQQALEHAGIGEADGVFFFADGAFAEVIKLGLGAESDFAVFGGFGERIDEWIGRFGRGFLRGRVGGVVVLGLRGDVVFGFLGFVGAHGKWVWSWLLWAGFSV